MLSQLFSILGVCHSAPRVMVSNTVQVPSHEPTDRKRPEDDRPIVPAFGSFALRERVHPSADRFQTSTPRRLVTV